MGLFPWEKKLRADWFLNYMKRKQYGVEIGNFMCDVHKIPETKKLLQRHENRPKAKMVVLDKITKSKLRDPFQKE